MGKSYKASDIYLSIDSIEPFYNEKAKGVCIKWMSNIGFGEYTIYKLSESEKWCADSEYMDSNEDKSFLKELLKIILDKVYIEG